MDKKISPETNVAIDAVRKASIFCNYILDEKISFETIFKEDGSPVTKADIGSAIIIISEIAKNFPHSSVVVEEDLSFLKNKKYFAIKDSLLFLINKVFPEFCKEDFYNALDFQLNSTGHDKNSWILDPIDGTKGFINGRKFAIALSKMENFEVMLGVISCPNINLHKNKPLEFNEKGLLFFSEKRKGAFLTGLLSDNIIKIHTNTISHPQDLTYTESFDNSHAPMNIHSEIAKRLGVVAPAIKLDGQGKYALLARGDFSLYFRLPKKKGHHEYIWDHSAGNILLTEAGGKVTDVYGNNLDFSKGIKLYSNTGIIASNKIIHDKILNTVQEFL